MPQRSHASYAALLSAQKGEKLAGRKCEKWGKTGWGVGGGVYYFSSMTAGLFSTQACTERLYKWNHCNNRKTKCLPLACNSCNGLIYLRLIKCMSLHQNSHFNNIDKTKRRQNSPPYNKNVSAVLLVGLKLWSHTDSGRLMKVLWNFIWLFLINQNWNFDYEREHCSDSYCFGVAKSTDLIKSHAESTVIKKRNIS